MTGQDIGLSIPNEKRPPGNPQRLLHHLQGLFDRPNGRFSASATMVGTVGAIKNSFDLAVFLGDVLQHVARDAVEFVLRVNALADPRLI